MERALVYREITGELVIATIDASNQVARRVLNNVGDEKLSEIGDRTGVVVELDADMGALTNLAHIKPLFGLNFFMPNPTAHECIALLIREPERFKRLLVEDGRERVKLV